MSKGWNRIAVILVAAGLLLSMTSTAFASLPELDIEASDQAAPGAAVPMIIEIGHTDSSQCHYVDNVRLYDGDRLLKEWTFDSTNYNPRAK